MINHSTEITTIVSELTPDVCDIELMIKEMDTCD